MARIEHRGPDPTWAWAPYRPDAERPWGLPLAAHLYRRAGFGAGWDTLQQAVSEGPERTLDRLLAPRADVASFDRSFDAHEEASIDPAGGSMETLAAWWLRRMLETPHPLQEKMTLFWHDFFGVSGATVGSARLMLAHLAILRRHALGRLQPLLETVIQDAALLVSYRGEANRRSQPSETYARRLMELLGFGPDQYSARDLRDLARSFTGWFVIRQRLRYLEHEHDPGPKRLFGQEGPWKGPDAVRILLAQQAAPRAVVRRLYRWLLADTEEPPPALVEPLARQFAADYDIGRLVRTILASNWFFSEHAYRQRIKSPVELVLGLAKAMETVLPTQPLARDLAELGQALGAPPTSKGWPAGPAWLNPFTLTRRQNLTCRIVAGAEPYGGRVDPLALARRHGKKEPAQAAAFFLELLVDGRVPAAVRQKLAGRPGALPGEKSPAAAIRHLVCAITALPEFQLA